MAVALFIVAAATSHSQTMAHPHWWSCREPERIHCIAHEMPKQHQRPVGFWQSCKKRCTVFPYFHRHVKHAMRSMYRQATRAVRGQTYRYETTGYAPPARCGASGLTASGIMPYYGVAASKLPFGTRGYVPGYGPFIAEDTGSAIGPGHLDLYFPSCAQAIAWGTRWLNVSIYR